MKFTNKKNPPLDKVRCAKHEYLPFPYRKNKGVSLVIAMIFIPVLMILVGFMVEPIIQSYRAAAADQKRMLAKAIAESLFEQALFDTKNLPTGANASGCLGESTTQGGGTMECTQQVDYGYGTATGQWWVYGQPETDEEHTILSQYYVPSLGTGDVGGDYCTSAEPVYETTTLVKALQNLNLPTDLITDPSDWPCNWGKLKEGESVIIPLYSHDEYGAVVNPGDINFELRVRAACNPDADVNREDAYRGEICSKERQERYVLAGDPEEGGDTVIAIWEITGKEGSESGKNIYLSGSKHDINPNINSIFFVRSINNYNISCSPNTLCENSKVKDQDDTKPRLAISEYLNNLFKPTLRLIVVHSLKEEGTNNKVPYLEYQFRTDAPGTGQPPISNSAKIVKVEVMVDGGYTETIEKTIGLPKPVTGFVIQQ